MWMGMVGDVKLVRGSHLVVVSTVVWCVFVNVSCLGKGKRRRWEPGGLSIQISHCGSFPVSQRAQSR